MPRLRVSVPCPGVWRPVDVMDDCEAVDIVEKVWSVVALSCYSCTCPGFGNSTPACVWLTMPSHHPVR